MAKNLRKFVNPKFLRTCDLSLMHRLMTRHASAIRGFELAVLDGDPELARDALSDFFAGTENGYPPGLTADLHRIAALGNRHGMRLIRERARSASVDMESAADASD